ncbi:MAG: glycosyltransferase [Nanoarchaeota archaeon]|nr:glycosyltransferase [Nanoarchaeota archaeon]
MKKIGKRRRLLGRVSKIIVETEMQSRQLKKIGIRSSKIRLIYPTVDEKFEYRPAKGNFKILYASCPTRVKDFDKRGINLLIDAAKDTTAVFCLAWRKKCFDQIKQMTRSISNIKLTNEISRSMNQKFADAHCTIIPYTKFDDYLKLIPNSAIESLAAKKPIIVSSKTEIAKIVEKEKCGEVFDPNKDSLLSAIERLKKGYNRYQKNCFKTFEKYFSQKKFLEAYTKVYQEFDKNVKV